MILSFDKFERYELPQATLCNPNSRATEVDGKITITDTVGVLSNPKGMNLKLNFNAPHELSFDYYRHKSTDPIKQSFYDSIYEAIQTDRYIYLTDIGYFIISSVTDSDEDNIDKKSITCKSCEENELATAEGLYLKEGTYYLHTEDNKGLIDLFLPKTAGWTIGFIDHSLLTKPYFVEETEVDNGYNFLYATIQDMFECIVEPDIIKRTVSVYSRVYYAEHHLTDIHIAKYNLLKHKTVEENDEDKYTALNVQGKDENLEIRTVSPTGKNVIYNFEPRYPWMSSALQVAVTKWQEKCESVEEIYLTLQQGYYTELEQLFNEEQNIEILKGELKTLEETRDAVIITVGEQQSAALNNVNAQIVTKQNAINTATSVYNTHKKTVTTNYEVPIAQINSDCALDITAVDINGNKIFTVELLNELMTHIKPTEYIDEYMLVTESMTYPQRFEKAKELMDRAQSQLVKISSGQKTYSIDTRSFLFKKQFKHFSEQLCAGAIIYVETKTDKMEQLHLTGIDINFDEKSTNFTLGNKYDRSDLKALYEEALGQNSKSFSELKYIASIIEDQQKQLDYQRNWVANLRTLTLDNVLTSEDQAIEINNRGLIGRKRQVNEDGSWKTDENGNPLFYSEQVKLINQTIVFTDDNWKTAKTAVGKIAVGYNPDGSVKYSYGINGQVLIGELILGNNLVLTGTSAGIKIKNNQGNDVFYADDDGNLVLSGTIYANKGKIGGWNLIPNYWNTSLLYTKVGNNIVYGTGMAGAANSNFNSTAFPAFWAGFNLDYAHPYSAGANDADWRNNTSFYVQHNGRLYASDAIIKGDITATSGNIAGWTIQTDGSGNRWLGTAIGDVDKTFFISSTGLKAYVSAIDNNKNCTIYSKGNFAVDIDGHLYANDANISGKITATSLTLIGDTKIPYTQVSGTPDLTKYVRTNVGSGSTYFKVATSGLLEASNAIISGTIYANQGNIGGWELRHTWDSNTITGSYLGTPWNDNNRYPVFISQSGCSAYVNTVGESKNCVFYSRGNFAVDTDGKLYADGATISGKITATSGAIGGWTLIPNYWNASLLYTKVGASHYGTGMAGAANSSFDSTAYPAFWAGFNLDYAHPYSAGANDADWRNNTSFYVQHNGRLYASDAIIKGDITATSGSFNGSVTATSGAIGGWTIRSDYLGTDWNDNNRYPIFISQGKSAYIPMLNANRTCIIYSRGNFAVDTDGNMYANNVTIKGTLQGGTKLQDGVVLGTSGNTEFCDHTYGNGSSTIWRHKIEPTSNIILSRENVVVSSAADILLESSNGVVRINDFNGAYGYIDVYKDNNQLCHMQLKNEKYIDLMIDGTKYLWCRSTNGGGGHLAGTWTSDNAVSDARFKNTIETLDDRYDIFFDSLRTKRYKYNHGTSDRFHTGYIAQEVVEALENANISTQEFAGVMLVNDDETNEERWYLRRDEFVTLNTWQIQKAKARITELETTVAELKNQIQTLTAG